MASEYNISLYAGETRDITIEVKTSNGDIFDLTDYDAELMVKYNKDLSDSDATIFSEGVIDNPELGVIVFSLDSSDTNIPARKYYYDIKIIGAKTKIVTYGLFEIKQPVNRLE